MHTDTITAPKTAAPAINNAPLSPLECIALASCIASGDITTYKQGTPEGKYPIDVTVRLQGVVSKSKDTPARQPAKVNVWAFCRLLASKLNGPTLDAAINEAIELYNKGLTTEDAETAFKQRVEDAFEKLGNATIGTRSGQTRVSVIPTVIHR